MSVDLPLPPLQTPDEVIRQLEDAAISNDVSDFKTILDHLSTIPDQFNIHDLTSVMTEAVRHNNADIVSELMRRGLMMHYTFALEAIRYRSQDALRVFLQNNWDINEPLSETEPPVLGYAVEDEAMTSWLLDHGADPNKQTLIDLTPLSFAVESASPHTIGIMFDKGGDVRKGELLQHAIDRHTDTQEVLALLLEQGAPLNSNMYENHYASRALYPFMGLGTPLHKAAELGKVDVVRYLLSAGAKTDIRDSKGRTALDCAEGFNHLEVAELLQPAKE